MLKIKYLIKRHIKTINQNFKMTINYKKHLLIKILIKTIIKN